MLYLTGASDLQGISLVVSIAVLILLCLSYVVLFSVWHKYYSKCVDIGLQDKQVNKELLKEYKKYLDKDLSKKNENFDLVSKEEYVDLEIEKIVENVEYEKRCQRRSLTLFSIFVYTFLFVIFAIGLYSRLDSGITNYFGKSYIVVETGSMEEVHENNTYIAINELDNQITQYSLIQLDVVTSEKEMNLYDIYAFYDDEGNIIIHRLINIIEENGEVTYRFRGDSNPVSAMYEINVPLDKVIARYTGTSSFFLGVSILYLQSNIGIITFAIAFLLLLFFDIFERRVNSVVQKRKMKLLEEVYPNHDFAKIGIRRFIFRRLFVRFKDNSKILLTNKSVVRKVYRIVRR